jgi:glycosyltransferase XagB
MTRGIPVLDVNSPLKRPAQPAVPQRLLPRLRAADAIAFPSLEIAEDELDFYLRNLVLPSHVDRRGPVVVTADASVANAARIRARYGDAVRQMLVPRQALLDAIASRFAAKLTDDAIHSLERSEPQFSAHRVVTAAQSLSFLAGVLAVAGLLLAKPYLTGLILIGLSAAGYIANAIFRAMLVWIGDDAWPAGRAAELPDAGARDLPLYSVIVPLNREANVLPALAAAMCALEYRADRLQILLVLEADDSETIAAAKSLNLDQRFELLHVPPSEPRTKPKACNYALRFVRGAHTVVYDAEDRPEPDQLRKAVAAFRGAADNVACLQARLNFFNARENWLTCMFTLDYSLWFDFLLPGLDRVGIPMPLGGTSNHFRTDALRAIHGWDAFNVTEDADLGIRLARMGYCVRTLDSTTFEEATNRFADWLKQRSRWLKGYMQTWLVHMREPVQLYRHAGLRGFLGFQFFVGGTFLSALLNPLLWGIFLVSLALHASSANSLFAGRCAAVSLAGLIAGNCLYVYLAMLGPVRRGWFELTPFGLTAPVYWLLISLAAYRGAWQLFRRPWHWEKTRHGLSRFSFANPL